MMTGTAVSNLWRAMAVAATSSLPLLLTYDAQRSVSALSMRFPASVARRRSPMNW